jgi:hypothetical protein
VLAHEPEVDHTPIVGGAPSPSRLARRFSLRSRNWTAAATESYELVAINR